MSAFGAILTIDLNAIRLNYQTLSAQLNGIDCACVVKANAYGLGVHAVAPALWDTGARTFFVALPEEGVELRTILPEADIHVLVGLLPNSEQTYLDHNLTPVLNSFDQIERWQNRGPCDLHIDTGMTRLGIPLNRLEDVPAMEFDIVMSHFACADEVDHPLNTKQINDFGDSLDQLTYQRASLANSAGIFLSSDAHFDMGRPGCALYGINPTPHLPNPMQNPVTLQGQIVQIHEIDTQESVGYGATQRLISGQKIATIAVGYADGYLRSLSSSGSVFIGDQEAKVMGRVSMDAIGIDVTDIDCFEGQWVDLIGPHNPPDVLAEQAGTIGYEILTNLGTRYQRVYQG
jgi:alanine racemase